MSTVFFLFMASVSFLLIMPQAAVARENIENVDAEKFAVLYRDVAEEALLLDIRTPAEFAEGHVEGSVNVDFFSPQFPRYLESLDKSRPVFVYCRSGSRSTKALNMMRGMGFSRVVHLQRGYISWVKNNFAIKK